MSAASDYLENKVLNHVLRNASYTQPSGLYVGLFTGNALANLESGTLSDEVSTSGTAYVRKAVTFANASSGTSLNNTTITFDAATASWGNISAIAICDAVTTGNVLFYGNLTTAKQIEIGDTLQFVTNNISVSLA
jgi:hypothetical protein